MDELGMPRRDRRACAEAYAARQDGGRPALTVRNIRRRADPCVAAQQNKNGMAEFEAHNLAEDGDVLVISGVSGVSNMGGISAYTASARASAARS